jgi:YidC/Oxa1 family membrane protein insertase
MEFGFFEIFASGLAAFFSLVKSYGLAIILLTLVVRILLLPLSIKQTRSMREMAVIQPEVKKIQAKYKGKQDRQKMNEEMMALYKEHSVNPFGGCLPLLMQFPVLIALFYVIRGPLKYLASDTALAGALKDSPLATNQFLGLRLDCLPSDVLAQEGSSFIQGEPCGTGFVSFLPYLFLILAMGLTTWYQQKQMQARQADSPQAQQMQMIGRIMPVLLMVFAYNFPTGVVIYWVTTNLWTIVQQRIILAAAPLPATTGNGKARPAKAKPTTGKPPSKEEKASGKTPAEGKEKKAPAGGTSKPHPSSKKKKKKRR